jgi:hypothetical protein
MGEAEREAFFRRVAGLTQVVFKYFKQVNRCFKDGRIDPRLKADPQDDLRKIVHKFISYKSIQKQNRTQNLIFSRP